MEGLSVTRKLGQAVIIHNDEYWYRVCVLKVGDWGCEVSVEELGAASVRYQQKLGLLGKSNLPLNCVMTVTRLLGSLRPTKVMLNFVAPKSVAILRQELLECDDCGHPFGSHANHCAKVRS